MFLWWPPLFAAPFELVWFDSASESLDPLFFPRQFIAPTGSAPSGVSAGFSYTRDELAVIGAALLILLVTALLGVFILRRRTNPLSGPPPPTPGGPLGLLLVACVPVRASHPLS